MDAETKIRKHLFDAQQACTSIRQFTAGRTFDDYRNDPMLRAGVERQFQLLGDGLLGVAEVDADLIRQTESYRRIIAFRNIVAHSYVQIDHRLVWGVIETTLAAVTAEVEARLRDRTG